MGNEDSRIKTTLHHTYYITDVFLSRTNLKIVFNNKSLQGIMEELILLTIYE